MKQPESKNSPAVEILSDELARVPVDLLEVHPENPRKGDVALIERLIRANGFFGALVVQRTTNRILVGNHRFMAARRAGLVEVPVLYVDVSDAEALQILLADNRPNDVAGYDDPTLASLLETLAERDSLGAVGYEDADLDALLRKIEAQSFIIGSGVDLDSARTTFDRITGDDGQGIDPTAYRIVRVKVASEADARALFEILGIAYDDETREIEWPRPFRRELESYVG